MPGIANEKSENNIHTNYLKMFNIHDSISQDERNKSIETVSVSSETFEMLFKNKQKEYIVHGNFDTIINI